MWACPVTGVANGGRFPYAVDPGETQCTYDDRIGMHRSHCPIDHFAAPAVRPKSLPKLLAQGKHWRRADGEWVRVKDMHPAHRANAARLLLRDAAEHARAVSMAELKWVFGAPEDVEARLAEADRARLADPMAWMRSTKLYRRLVKDLPLDAEAVARLTALPDFTLTIPVGGPPAVTYPTTPTDPAPKVDAADPWEQDAQRRALRAVLAVFEERTKLGGDLWSRAIRQSDVPAMVAEAAKQIGVTL